MFPNVGRSVVHSKLRCFVIAGLLALIGAVLPGRVAAQTTFAVTAADSQNYTINGQLDPALTLVRGVTYTFNVSVASVHPFYIKTQPGAGTGNQWTDGVTGNGVTSGALTFAVPANAPSVLYYQCSAHGAMSGVLNIQSAQATPSAGPGWLALLAVVLLALGALTYGTRRVARRA